MLENLQACFTTTVQLSKVILFNKQMVDSKSILIPFSMKFEIIFLLNNKVVLHVHQRAQSNHNLPYFRVLLYTKVNNFQKFPFVCTFIKKPYLKVCIMYIHTALQNFREKYLIKHTVSSQDFRSFFFLSVFLSKNVQLKFFCEITTYTSRLLSFDKFFPIWS